MHVNDLYLSIPVPAGFAGQNVGWGLLPCSDRESGTIRREVHRLVLVHKLLINCLQ